METATTTITITANSYAELEEKKAVINAVLKLDTNSITKIKTMANSPKVEELLRKKWAMIKMFL